MANKVGWGQGSVNNDIGWGQGAVNNSVDWGNIQAISPSGETNIVGGSAADERFIITVKTDNAGTSGTNQFTIPTIGTGYNYDIEYDGQTLTGQTGSVTLTFPSGAGTYDIKISGSFTQCYFVNGGDKAKLLDIKNFGIYALGSTSQFYAFYGCSNMTITATDSGNFGSVTDFRGAFNNCTSLTSFPLIDTSQAILFGTASFNGAFQNCSSLISLPLLNTSNVTSFDWAFQNCSSLVSFPALNFDSATDCNNILRTCSSLINFPQNVFDNCTATDYTNSFLSTNLTTQSIDDILISIDTAGQSNGTFTQSGGQAPSATGQTAITNLVGKGWTITVTT